MSWRLSRFHAGDVVEVRSKEEILATLDENGCIDGLPFMPEMLQFCGQRLPVRAVAHKTCETALKTAQGRRLPETVHLANTRCDGSAHGGCQADCALFWKDAWLKPVNGTAQPAPRASGAGLSAEQLMERTRSGDVEGNFICQATKIFDAGEPLPWWNLRQYVLDVSTGNVSLLQMLRVTWLGTLRGIRESIPLRPVRGVFGLFVEWMHRLLTGRAAPRLFATVRPLLKTPSGRLGLAPGDLVRIKSQVEIEKTLDKSAKNRGLFFDKFDMAPFCGGTYRVRRLVHQILDEATGEMLQMKEPCIILEDVFCKAEFSPCRLNCPRAFYSYWRELWLERVETT